MARKIYPKGKVLMEKFITAIGSYEGFEILRQDTVCQFRFDGVCYYAYFKCISHEGNPYPLEHQRAQLPQRKEFDEIKDSSDTFLFLGYDIDNDVFVCWEPHKIKARLNRKSYVSFYSRLSAQQNVVEGKVKEEILTNGDKFVLFKRTDVIPFLQMIDTHFPELITTVKVSTATPEIIKSETQRGNGKYLQGRLLDVKEDESIQLLIDSYPEDSSTLAIIGECMNQYGQYYNKMQFSDWGRLVRSYLKAKFDE